MCPMLFHLPAYWIMTGSGLLALTLGAVWRAPRVGVPRGIVARVALVGIVAGYFGAQLFSIILTWGWIRSHWWMSWWQQFGQTGLVLYGWMLVGFAAGSVYVLRRGLPWLKLADHFAPWIMLAQAFNRVGCFLTGCCYGKPTTLPWGLRFPSLREAVHPTQLYELGADLLVFFWLLALTKRKHDDGQVALRYFLSYAVWRFGVESLRGDARAFFGPLSFSQGLSLGIIAVSVTAWRLMRTRHSASVSHVEASAG